MCIDGAACAVTTQQSFRTHSAVLFLVLSLFSQPTFAQTGTGEILGRVTDPLGRPVVQGAVTVTNIDTGANRHISTGGGGRFAAPALPVGRYQVTVEREGYASRRQDDIVLLPGQRLSIEIQLRLAVLPETIALTPYPPLLAS